MPAFKTRTVPALYNALTILELLASSRSGLTLPELVVQSSRAKSSVHYLLVTLERCGYVNRNARSGRYTPGMKLLGMATSSLSSLGVRQRTAPYLAGLRLRTGLTVHLAILEQTDAVLIAKLEAARVTRLASWVGKRMDLHCTAIGKALLGFLPEAEVKHIINKHGLARRNENTLCTTRRLREELDRVAKCGYAFDNEEDELGVRCLGVPVIGPLGRPVAAISVAGATSELAIDDIQRLREELQRTAAAIGSIVVESMAYTPSTPNLWAAIS